MVNKIFNPKNIEKLNNPERLKMLPPDFIIEKSNTFNPNTIVDIGAGTGIYCKAFAELFPDCKIYACDISDTMINWMNDNIKPKFKNIYPLIMADNKTSLNAELADMILMVNLHHELDKPLMILEEAYRLTKPNGRIVISDWKKEPTLKGPSIDIRIGEHTIKEQLIQVGYKKIEIFNDLQSNYVVIGQK